MFRRTGYAPWAVNLLVALAISLVVNFSYMLLLLVDDRPNDLPSRERMMSPSPGCRTLRAGVVAIHPDGYGYLLADGDSIYVSPHRIKRYGLKRGDRVRAHVRPGRDGGHDNLHHVLALNGEAFDRARIFQQSSHAVDFGIQLLYYLLLSFVFVTLLTAGGERKEYRASFYARRVGWCLAVALPLYLVVPVVHWPSGKIMLNFMSGRLFDYIVVLRHTFTLIVSLLYGYLFGLLRRSQRMALENERLQNENLTSRYNMLVSQINPHFFFNSLNSLSMLVREAQNDRALVYIDQLSYAFRYIIQNGQNMLVRLDEEARFAEAYSYLFKIRYTDKLFFDIRIDAEYRDWLLPALSLQPLMGNAVKHNAITRLQPFHVRISTEKGYLIVSNPKIPKLDPEPGTGIGLENLRNRWELITGCRIEVVSTDELFEVRLPLQKPDAK